MEYNRVCLTHAQLGVVLEPVFAWLEGGDLARAGATCGAWHAAAHRARAWRRLLCARAVGADHAVRALAQLYEGACPWRSLLVAAEAPWRRVARLAPSPPPPARLVAAALARAGDLLALAAEDCSFTVWAWEQGRWVQAGAGSVAALGWTGVTSVEWAPDAPHLLLAGSVPLSAQRGALAVMQPVTAGSWSAWRVVSRTSGGGGCWAGTSFLSLELRRLSAPEHAPHFATDVWLNAATQEADDEFAGVAARVLCVYNEARAVITWCAWTCRWTRARRESGPRRRPRRARRTRPGTRRRPKCTRRSRRRGRLTTGPHTTADATSGRAPGRRGCAYWCWRAAACCARTRCLATRHRRCACAARCASAWRLTERGNYRKRRRRRRRRARRRRPRRSRRRRSCARAATRPPRACARARMCSASPHTTTGARCGRAWAAARCARRCPGWSCCASCAPRPAPARRTTCARGPTTSTSAAPWAAAGARRRCGARRPAPARACARPTTARRRSRCCWLAAPPAPTRPRPPLCYSPRWHCMCSSARHHALGRRPVLPVTPTTAPPTTVPPTNAARPLPVVTTAAVMTISETGCYHVSSVARAANKTVIKE